MNVHLHWLGETLSTLWSSWECRSRGAAEFPSTMGEGAGGALATATLRHKTEAKFGLRPVRLLAQLQLLVCSQAGRSPGDEERIFKVRHVW